MSPTLPLPLVRNTLPFPQLAASPFPHLFQRKFTAARSSLLAWLDAASKHESFPETTAGQLVTRSVRSGV